MNTITEFISNHVEGCTAAAIVIMAIIITFSDCDEGYQDEKGYHKGKASKKPKSKPVYTPGEKLN